MTRNLITSVTLLLALMSPLASAGDDWSVDFKKALDASKKSGKPLLVDFTGSDWASAWPSRRASRAPTTAP